MTKPQICSPSFLSPMSSLRCHPEHAIAMFLAELWSNTSHLFKVLHGSLLSCISYSSSYSTKGLGQPLPWLCLEAIYLRETQMSAHRYDELTVLRSRNLIIELSLGFGGLESIGQCILRTFSVALHPWQNGFSANCIFQRHFNLSQKIHGSLLQE